VGNVSPREINSIIRRCDSEHAKHHQPKSGLLQGIFKLPTVKTSTSLFSTKPPVKRKNPFSKIFKKPLVLGEREVFNNSRAVKMGVDYNPELLSVSKNKIYDTRDLYPLPKVDMAQFNEKHFVRLTREYSSKTAFKSYGRTYNKGVLELIINKET
jgi:hypothetical protein